MKTITIIIKQFQAEYITEMTVNLVSIYLPDEGSGMTVAGRWA